MKISFRKFFEETSVGLTISFALLLIIPLAVMLVILDYKFFERKYVAVYTSTGEYVDYFDTERELPSVLDKERSAPLLEAEREKVQARQEVVDPEDSVDDREPEGEENGNESKDIGVVTGGLALVEEVEVEILESFPVQYKLVLRGHYRNGCQRKGDLKYILKGNTVEVTMTTRSEGDICLQALVPWTESIFLNMPDGAGAEYTVRANGVTTTFKTQ